MFVYYILIFVVVLRAALSESSFRCDYTNLNETKGGWFKFHRIPAKWHDAQLRCHLEGAVLASPLNKELAWSMITVSKSSQIYTGIHSTFSGGDFTSIEGIPLSMISHEWSKHEPNNFKDDCCIVMQDDGTLLDVNCNHTFPYVCYKKHDKPINVTPCGTVDPDYTLDPLTGSCYKFHTTPRTWSRAFMACHAEGGHLAVINSDAEAGVLKDLFARYPDRTMTGAFYKGLAHIGFQDWGERGDWRTIHGETLKEAGYDKFERGQWNNYNRNGEFCGSIFRSGMLNDYVCNRIAAFICEKPPHSLLCTNDGN